MKLAKFAAAAAVAFGSVAGAGVAHAAPVALQLALVIDVSGSVDDGEYSLQLNGYRDAFKSAAIGGAIASFAAQGGIAVGVYMFATTTQPVLSWTQLTSAADADAFGTSIGNITRPASGGASGIGLRTNIASGIDAAVAGMAGNLFTSSRQIIDVSGDGQQNQSRDGLTQLTFANGIPVLEAARNDADALGIIINGLAILDDFATLDAYYDDHMRTGAGSFVLSATFANFAEAIETKIGREILNVPEPGSLALVGVALAGLGFMRRRRVV